jgi:hypothetical protein
MCRFNARPPQSSFTLGTRIRHGGSFHCRRMARRTMNMKDRTRIALFAQGATYCAVCAPLEVSADMIETEVAIRNRAVRDAEWKIAAGPMIDGRPNSQSCPHDEGRRHWLGMLVIPSFL